MHERSVRSIDIIGRRVDFNKNLPIAWGVEIDIPLGLAEKKLIKKYSGVAIPGNISKTTYLDMNPQESLPARLRNIESNWRFYNNTTLQDLAKTGRETNSIRRQRLAEIFFLLLGKNTDSVHKFNFLLSENKGKEIVIVYGHAGYAPLAIGEQTTDQPDFREDRKVQVAGNSVAVNRILKKYNDPNKHSAVLLACCYLGESKIHGLNVPIIYPMGEFEGTESWKGLTRTEIFVPTKR